jgi:hypothetical protein
MRWRSLDAASSNIEYLTIKNMPCQSQDLRYIFRWASGLKYLDIDLSFDRLSSDYQSKLSSEHPLPRMSMLRTAIFNIDATHSELEPYFRCMPSLNRLEIKTYKGYSDVSAWETLLQTSLQSLVYFTLEITMAHLTDADMSNILKSTQTPFWIEKENFNVVIKCTSRLGNYQFSLANLNNFNQYRSDEPVARWWIVPQRKLNDNLSTSNRISRLHLCSESLFFLQSYYLENVTHLVITELNDGFFESMIRHVNCSRIKYLDVSSIKEENNKISSLLPYTRNITSLRINLNQLSDHQFAYLKECSGIIYLDISADEHRFDTNNISVIGNMFPNLEHLTINTQDLWNVPKLQTYLPRLHSLTFLTITIAVSMFLDDGYEGKLFDHTLRRKAEFLFQRERNYITVWIDRAALQDSYWRRRDATDITNSSSVNSTKQSWPTKMIKKLSSFFKK